MSKHTPGPWKLSVGNFVGGGNYIHVSKPTGPAKPAKNLFWFPSGSTATEEDIANARLVAAAPDMLQALHDCITSEGSHAVASQDVDKLLRRLREIDRIAREAVNKATGGSNE